MAAGYINTLECPKGCKAGGGKPIAATVRGWKKHMTRNHDGYTEEQLTAVVGATAPDAGVGRDLFLNEIESGVQASIGGEVKPIDDATGAATPPVVDIRTDATSRKLSAKMNKMKKNFADQIPKIVNAALKQKGDEWIMDDSDKEMLSESVESCFDVLDIQFQMAPMGFVLENPLWVLLYPVLTLAFIFGIKAVKNQPQKEGDNG